VSAAETPATAPIAPTAASPAEPSEEHHRLAVLAASGPLLLLLAPLLLPLDDRGPMYTSARHEPGVFAILAFFFFWPLFVGAVGLRGALTRRAPGRAAYALPAVVQMLGMLGLALLIAQELSRPWRSRTQPGFVAALVLSVVTLLVLLRGFWRTGWVRYAQVVAGMWLVFLTGVLLTSTDSRDLFDPPESGGWVLLFALSAAAPAVGWILTRRRAR
jgi:hypothetical protein